MSKSRFLGNCEKALPLALDYQKTKDARLEARLAELLLPIAEVHAEYMCRRHKPGPIINYDHCFSEMQYALFEAIRNINLPEGADAKALYSYLNKAFNYTETDIIRSMYRRPDLKPSPVKSKDGKEQAIEQLAVSREELPWMAAHNNMESKEGGARLRIISNISRLFARRERGKEILIAVAESAPRGITYSQIAESMGIRPGTIKKTVSDMMNDTAGETLRDIEENSSGFRRLVSRPRKDLSRT